jgi:hypothetical protein
MARRRGVLAIVAASALVTACGALDDAGTSTTSAPLSSLDTYKIAPSTTVLSTTEPPPTTAASSTAAPASPSPTVASSPPPVVQAPSTTLAGQHCQSAPDPPAEAKNLQSLLGDLDGNGNPDAIWLYDLADGPHLQIRSDRGVTDAIRLGFGDQTVALGLSQVDLVVGAADPGTPQEILAIVAGADGSRLVGVYTLALRNGCLDEFEFPSGAPFVYLVGRNGTYTGLQCAADGATSHLVAISAAPTSSTTYATDHIVFRRNGKRLEPLMTVPGTLTLPADQAKLTASGDVTGCYLSRPAF